MKKSFRRFTALGLAAITAVPAMCVAADAATTIQQATPTPYISGTMTTYYISKTDTWTDPNTNNTLKTETTSVTAIKYYKDSTSANVQKNIDDAKTAYDDAIDLAASVVVGSTTYSNVTKKTTYSFIISADSTSITSVFAPNSTIYIVDSTGEINNVGGAGTRSYIVGTAPAVNPGTPAPGTNTWVQPLSTYCYGTVSTAYLASNGYYYPSSAAVSSLGLTVTRTINSNGYATSRPYFNYMDGQYYTTQVVNSFYIYGLYNGGSYNTGYGSYLASNGLYYETMSALNASGYAYSSTYLSSAYGSYFSRKTGLYYSSYSAALTASGNVASYVITINYNGYYGNGYYYGSTIYYNSATGMYYPTESMARNANTNGSVTTSSTTTTGTYFNLKTGQYYSTYTDAAAVGGGSYVYNCSTGTMYSTATTTVVPNNGYYYYNDPYYYYNGMGLGYTTIRNTNKYANDTTSARIYGSSKRVTWNEIINYVKTCNKGSVVQIDMRDDTIIDGNALSAAKSRNITLKCYLSNGATFIIRPGDIDSARDININTEYNTRYIPTKLVNKAKKLNKGTKSIAQISIGNGNSFGCKASTTIKFSSSRAGCAAKLYRYNADRSSLVLVDKSTVSSNGAVQFDINKGGNFVVVIIK